MRYRKSAIQAFVELNPKEKAKKIKSMTTKQILSMLNKLIKMMQESNRKLFDLIPPGLR